MKKFFIKFISSFILDKEKRKEFRTSLKKKYITYDTSKMKLGVSYSLWDSEELLESSIKSIRKNVNYINVVWQKYSWNNVECSPNLQSLLNRLKKEGLIDEIIFYDHSGITNNAPSKEREKRNIGLQHALNKNCNYFMTIDADEFYKEEQFIEAKKMILQKGATHTACPIYNYWKKPIYRTRDIVKLTVPFIYKIDKNSKFEKFEHFPAHCDATRHMPLTKNSRFFFLTEIQMHHMSYIRNNMEKKLKSASTSRSNTNQLILKMYKDINDKTLEKHGLIKTENNFGINIGD